jgi:hypothetical protein
VLGRGVAPDVSGLDCLCYLQRDRRGHYG